MSRRLSDCVHLGQAEDVVPVEGGNIGYTGRVEALVVLGEGVD